MTKHKIQYGGYEYINEIYDGFGSMIQNQEPMEKPIKINGDQIIAVEKLKYDTSNNYFGYFVKPNENEEKYRFKLNNIYIEYKIKDNKIEIFNVFKKEKIRLVYNIKKLQFNISDCKDTDINSEKYKRFIENKFCENNRSDFEESILKDILDMFIKDIPPEFNNNNNNYFLLPLINNIDINLILNL